MQDVCILLLQRPHGTLGIVFCFINLSYQPGATRHLIDDFGHELLLLYVIHEDLLIQLVELVLLIRMALATHTLSSCIPSNSFRCRIDSVKVHERIFCFRGILLLLIVKNLNQRVIGLGVLLVLVEVNPLLDVLVLTMELLDQLVAFSCVQMAFALRILVASHF